jgi:hypothetical protein
MSAYPIGAVLEEERQGGTRTVSLDGTCGSNGLRLTAAMTAAVGRAEAFLIRLRTRKARLAALAGVLTVNACPARVPR